MACMKGLGLWLFIILTGVSYSYPTKKGSHDVPASGFTDTSAASSQAFQNAPPKQASSIQYGAQMRPTPALYNSNAFVAPVYLAYDGIAPDSTSFHVSPNDDYWAIQPPGPFSGGTSFRNLRLSSGPESLGLSYARQSVPVQSPFRPGESSFVEKVYDHGNYNSQTEDQGFPFPYGPVRAPTRYPAQRQTMTHKRKMAITSRKMSTSHTCHNTDELIAKGRQRGTKAMECSLSDPSAFIVSHLFQLNY
ncbi:uncharacterized protein LOC121634224 [Melanotaenia boesemani]|uniref:uncharacterized protein LOC121634224 n=1 Tax=Melanotaenia boesemani TaxID=1250792 RepID=UPI001C057779|nr:uncharacterized protein LOC121634224 [Melanotaenia boesemani]